MFLSKYPKAIPYLFMTEMWERFSYYGITAILILYMSKTFTMSTDEVYGIYGAYGALVYMTPLIGGWLADRYLGRVATVIIGAVFIALGQFIVAMPSTQLHVFYYGLAVVIVGTGLFIPNINAIVGELYDAKDPNRENGFTLAYMGRNIGTILAPIVASEVAALYNWRLAFMVAACGMLIGLSVFLMGLRHYHKRSSMHSIAPFLLIKIVVSAVLLSGIVFALMAHNQFVGPLLILTVIGISLYFIALAFKETALQRDRIFAAMVLTAFYIVFLILLQQSGGALNLFTDQFVNRHIGGMFIETGIFQSVEPLALILLSPFYNWLWTSLAKNKRYMSDASKFVLALILMSSSFVLMAIAMNFADLNGLISMHWINATYLLQAAGELFIGPIGLAMVSKLIPKKVVGLYMGYWVLATAVANFIAAKIGAFITPSSHDVGTISKQIAIRFYQTAFFELSLLGFVSVICLYVLVPKLNKLINNSEGDL